VAFVNNYITKQKHGGKTFFPGEGVPPEGQSQTAQTQISPLELQANSGRHFTPGGPFSQFYAQQRGGLA
jgi:hypothetical protein